MAEHVAISVTDGIQKIRMNRPDKKNALTGEMYTAMADALVNAGKSAEIHCTVLFGVPGAFCAGNDIGDFIQAASAGLEGIRPVANFLEALIAMPKPLLAAVDGLAIGVGTTMLMHCDYVLASPEATFATPFVDLGLVPEAGSSLIGPRIMGYQKAFALLAMGEKFSARDAENAGFVNRVVDSAQLETLIGQAAGHIADQPPEALRISRELLRGKREDIGERMREESAIFTERLKSDEARQAFMSFMAKGQKKAG